jgi:hypothetical protein
METQVGPFVPEDPGLVPTPGPRRPETRHHDAAQVRYRHSGTPLGDRPSGEGVEGSLGRGDEEGQPERETVREAGKRRKALEEFEDPSGPERIGPSKGHTDTRALDPLETEPSFRHNLGENPDSPDRSLPGKRR